MRSAPWMLGVAALALASCRDEAPPSNPDRDGDGFAAAGDCDDANAAVHVPLTAYADVDRDGVGAGPATTICTDGSPPAGYAPTAGDCAPSDAAAWRTVALVDRDGDGRTAKDVPLCVGATVPEPYRTAATGNDCDDADPARFDWVVAYTDQDGDGIGVPPRSVLCTDGALPSGRARAGYDADDRDPSVGRVFSDDDLALVLE